MLTEPTKIKGIALRLLTLNKDVQVRGKISHHTVGEYAELMSQGVKLPPPTVFYRFGSEYYVADGWHRVLAARRLELPSMMCEVRDGSKRDAILFAAGANAHHGLRRTNEDKRWAVLSLLLDEEWQKWSSTHIARICNVSPGLVEAIRTKIGGKATPKSRKQTRSGKVVFVTTPEKLEIEIRRCPTCGRPIE